MQRTKKEKEHSLMFIKKNILYYYKLLNEFYIETDFGGNKKQKKT